MGSQLHAEILYMGIYRPGIAIVVEIPHSRQNLLPRQGNVLILCHVEQQFKLSGGQRNFFASGSMQIPATST